LGEESHGTPWKRKTFDALATAGAEYAEWGLSFNSQGTKLAWVSFLQLGKTFRKEPDPMAFTREEAVTRARQDLATRIAVKDTEIEAEAIEDADFPDMALGAATNGEMSGQMITPGWRIRLQANGNSFEYRANKHQIRLFDYQGRHYRI
jgi:hypothetical protein